MNMRDFVIRTMKSNANREDSGLGIPLPYCFGPEDQARWRHAKKTRKRLTRKRSVIPSSEHGKSPRRAEIRSKAG